LSEQPPESLKQQPPEQIRIGIPKSKPIVTYVLIGVTAFFYVIQFLVQSVTGNDLLFYFGGKIKPFIEAGQFWRLITPILLHGSILHVALNMYALFILGSRLERFYGHGRFLLLYLLSGFAGNVFSFVLSENSSLGASTAVFGLLAAEGVFIFQNRKLFGQARTRQALMNLLIVLGINLAYGFMPQTQIDNMGHIGGFIGGAFFAWKGGPLLKLKGITPFFEIVNDRKNNDVTIASIVVLIGFAIIAAIPFISN
jgi:rhomboid protease GluP